MPDTLPRASFRANVVNLFRAYPNTWLDARNFQRVAGFMAWRTRISDARRMDGMDIRNRQRKVGNITVSEYMWVVLPSQPALTVEDTHAPA